MINGEVIQPVSNVFEFVPERGVSGWHKIELVSTHLTVMGERDREMLYHRHSFQSVSGGDFEFLYDQPFGLPAVEG